MPIPAAWLAVEVEILAVGLAPSSTEPTSAATRVIWPLSPVLTMTLAN